MSAVQLQTQLRTTKDVLAQKSTLSSSKSCSALPNRDIVKVYPSGFKKPKTIVQTRAPTFIYSSFHACYARPDVTTEQSSAEKEFQRQVTSANDGAWRTFLAAHQGSADRIRQESQARQRGKGILKEANPLPLKPTTTITKPTAIWGSTVPTVSRMQAQWNVTRHRHATQESLDQARAYKKPVNALLYSRAENPVTEYPLLTVSASRNPNKLMPLVPLKHEKPRTYGHSINHPSVDASLLRGCVTTEVLRLNVDVVYDSTGETIQRSATNHLDILKSLSLAKVRQVLPAKLKLRAKYRHSAKSALWNLRVKVPGAESVVIKGEVQWQALVNSCEDELDIEVGLGIPPPVTKSLETILAPADAGTTTTASVPLYTSQMKGNTRTFLRSSTKEGYLMKS